MAQRTHELQELSLRDPLTGLRNHRYFWEVVPRGAVRTPWSVSTWIRAGRIVRGSEL